MVSKFTDAQLRFDLDLDEVNEDAVDRAIPPAEARQISEAARLAFEQLRASGEHEQTWFNDYLRLSELAWPWRVATYIAWASSPKKDRWPATVAELATQVLGLTGPRQIYTWRKKYPAIDATVAMLQAAPLWEHRRDVLDALVASASNPDYKHHPDRKLFLEMLGDYVPRSQLDIGRKASGDITELSDAELEALIGDRLTGDGEEATDDD